MSVDGEAQRASPSGKSTTPLEEQQAAVNAIQSVKSHCEMFLTTLHQLSVEQNQLQEERKALQETQQRLFGQYKQAYTQMRTQQGASKEDVEAEVNEFNQQLIFHAIDDKASIEGQTVEKLVLDTAAFIKQVRFERIGKEYYTIPAVVKEIRDKNAKAFYENFPFDIVLKEPHPLAFQAVCNFAKKTGDYSVLSATDLKVLALQYTLEREAHGNVDHLRTEPQTPQESSDRPNQFFSPTEVLGKSIGVGNWGEGQESGWISPENVEEYTSCFTETLDSTKAEEAVKVACLTLDFAMQNVILQMNMNLVSVDGVSIKSAQKWIKRCLACRTFCKDLDQEYCKSCGGHSLQKLSYTVNQDGSIHYNLPRNKPSLRGTIYPIPLSKGGKREPKIYVSPQQLPKERRKDKDMEYDDPELAFLGKGEQRGPVVGYGKKNPNQARRKIGKKNKTQGQQ